MTTQRSRTRARGGRADVHAGRRLSLAVEALGEALRRQPDLPAGARAQAAALAEGRSTVPADGDVADFPSRVRAWGPAVDGVEVLTGWLGCDLTAWVAGSAPAEVRDAAEVAVEARVAVREPWEPLARAYREWWSAGLPAASAEVYARASEIALGEAVDRWCALGCEGDLGRYVATWQRSASGWADTVLGTAVAVDVGDLARLRELSSAATALSANVAVTGVTSALATRLGWTRPEVERVLQVEAAVRARTDPRAVLRRRWAIVEPIARAVGALEKDLGRLPTIPEIAERAGVHEVSVELALEALEAG